MSTFASNGCHGTPCAGVTVAYSNGDGTFQTVAAFGDNSVGGGDPLDVICRRFQ